MRQALRIIRADLAKEQRVAGNRQDPADLLQCCQGQADRAALDGGDVFDAEAAARMLNETAASGVFIARGTYGNPWIFTDALACAREGLSAPQHDAVERLDALREHLGLVHRYLPFMARARTFATWYLKGMPHAAAWRGRVVQCTTYDEFMELVDEIQADVANEA